jgi:oxygen-dependent protoporphyrinogen oxidase
MPAGDFARKEWIRPTPASPPTGRIVVGESVAGSGLARVIAHANAACERLLAD